MKKLWMLMLLTALAPVSQAAEPIVIGLSYPKSGAQKWLGLSQMRGALMAADKINATGGLLGRPLELRSLDSAGKAKKAVANVDAFLDQGAVMIVGSATSEEAIAVGQRAEERGVPYFVPLAYGNEVTSRYGHSYLFREGPSARMANNVLMEYLGTQMPNQRYFIITGDDVIRSGGVDSLVSASRSGEVSSPAHYRAALKLAAESDAQILVLMLYGEALTDAMRMVERLRLKERMAVVVPNLSDEAVLQAGPTVMEGVIGSTPWTWRSPEREQNEQGKAFVDAFVKQYGDYPSSVVASTYSAVMQWADAVSRANTTSAVPVIQALEGHRYQLLKDEQVWRALDHQNIQSMFVVKVRKRADVMRDELKQDYFEELYWMESEVAAPTEAEVRLERSLGTR
ncbi:branched-chain amino acid ABC transporter substrate-binding protein [Pseudomonas sp. BN414]|uniref:ABC transporter substrate-binding protein n=1 Tax=Pseudomonas sp. BN414 TaxID=2567888 RepID=UPI002455DBD6|nr:ABC transporter substrate-binding protein [Pseudomonas sp. BN414]MDH4565233.1 branched-chain amino acid ABC transporter substrate-binding protein [Pseudomonas sp. BN414]